ncbi:MAG: acyltransferase family protein [Lachnospiraceae bacterium]|nr:acyltransferase family protein [Lachnospiraceae bacterium]
MSIKAWVQSWYNPELRKEGDNRDYFVDNLKAFLMVLVIFGHVVTSLRGVKEMSALYYFVYTFHMPLFVFTSGYMAKGIMKDGKFRVDRYFSILWMYFFFRVANYLLGRQLGHSSKFKLLEVSGAPWYLLAMSAWYLMVPLLLSMKPLVGVIVATMAGLLMGYVEEAEDFLAISRIAVYLPFFAIGLYVSKERLDNFLNKRLRIPALLLLAGACGYFVFVGNPLKPIKKIVFGGTPYSATLGELEPYGFLIRGGLYLFAVLIGVACMFLIPRRKMWFSYVGKYSMAVYILHIFVRDAMKYTGVFTEIKKLPGRYMFLAIPACAVAALVLGNPLFGKLINWISNPFRSLKRKKA